jgi:hypothetical protein
MSSRPAAHFSARGWLGRKKLWWQKVPQIVFFAPRSIWSRPGTRWVATAPAGSTSVVPDGVACSRTTSPEPEAVDSMAAGLSRMCTRFHLRVEGIGFEPGVGRVCSGGSGDGGDGDIGAGHIDGSLALGKGTTGGGTGLTLVHPR